MGRYSYQGEGKTMHFCFFPSTMSRKVPKDAHPVPYISSGLLRCALGGRKEYQALFWYVDVLHSKTSATRQLCVSNTRVLLDVNM
jgi:hypothetical protein